MSLRVLGVDACKHGWVGIAVDRDGFAGAYIARHIEELVAAAEADGVLGVVVVDMPIGLPDAGPRQADLLARHRVGRLRSSVFVTPIRAALVRETYEEANQVSRGLAGVGLSRQAYGLRPKLLEIDGWVQQARQRVVEVHPEVSFASLAGTPLTASRKTWAGVVRRRELLATAGIDLPEGLGSAGAAGVDDVLDAAAASWTARRVVLGEAEPLPDPPEQFSDGILAAIWC